MDRTHQHDARRPDGYDESHRADNSAPGNISWNKPESAPPGFLRISALAADGLRRRRGVPRHHVRQVLRYVREGKALQARVRHIYRRIHLTVGYPRVRDSGCGPHDSLQGRAGRRSRHDNGQRHRADSRRISREGKGEGPWE